MKKDARMGAMVSLFGRGGGELGNVKLEKIKGGLGITQGLAGVKTGKKGNAIGYRIEKRKNRHACRRSRWSQATKKRAKCAGVTTAGTAPVGKGGSRGGGKATGGCPPWINTMSR